MYARGFITGVGFVNKVALGGYCIVLSFMSIRLRSYGKLYGMFAVGFLLMLSLWVNGCMFAMLGSWN